MALKNLSDWNEKKAQADKGTACGTACGAGKPAEKPVSACGAGEPEKSLPLVVQHVGPVSPQNLKRNLQPVAVHVGLENNFSNL